MPSKRIYIGLGIAMICITITYCFFETDLLARICMGAVCILFSIGCYQKFTSVQQTDETDLSKRKRKVLIYIMSGFVLVELMAIFINYN